jgi:meso-butanediol dehydrogenase / (S,S)-butanediol dehydrogenase / diacetyl reductase
LTEAPGAPRVALVTGAGSGIGAATVRLLIHAGWRVALCGRRESVLQTVGDATDGLVIACDLSEPSQCRTAVELTITEFGGLDGLVLNAGVTTPGTAEETELTEWERTLRINLTAPFLMSRAALPALREARGSIVTVGSIGALRAAPRSVAYGASKAGLVALTQALALDHGPEGVRANCVCPGWTRSEMSDAEMAAIADEKGIAVEEAYRRATAFVPQRRPASPVEVGQAIVWLLSPEASYVNGATLTVDGGTSIVDAGTIIFSDSRAGQA